MKFIAIFGAIMVVVAVIAGFDFKRYNVSDLSSYPDLDYESVVCDFADSSHGAITSAFVILQDVSETIFFIFNPSAGSVDPNDPDAINPSDYWSEEDQFYLVELWKIRDELSLFDYLRVLWSMTKLKEAPDYLEDLYFKYFGTEGASGDGG